MIMTTYIEDSCLVINCDYCDEVVFSMQLSSLFQPPPQLHRSFKIKCKECEIK